MDAKPQSTLDDLWITGLRALRFHSLPTLVRFRDLVWGLGRDLSPLLDKDGKSSPLMAEFRESILTSFDLPHLHTRDCDHLSVEFIWRRDYVAHPRNPTGRVTRKIRNEAEILTHAQKLFPGYNITGIELDLLSIRDQLKLLSQTDVMIGMHGAAFGFSLFLPPGGGVIEMYPGRGQNWHMKRLASANNLHYLHMMSTKEDKTSGFSTISPTQVEDSLRAVSAKICTRRVGPTGGFKPK